MNLMGAEDMDDTELVRAYDKAVKGWRKSKGRGGGGGSQRQDEAGPTAGIGPWIAVTKDSSNNCPNPSAMINVGRWVLGSPCRSVWTSDGLEYEAKIISIEGIKCTIRFVGYGNQETKDLTELKETFGKRSRDRQRREAQTSSSNLLTTGNPFDMNGGEDYFSSVSLTSSMCNNCGDPSRDGDRDDDDQLTTTTEFSGLRDSVSSSNALGSPVKPKALSPAAIGKVKRKRDDYPEPMKIDLVDGSESAGGQSLSLICGDVEKLEDILPSGAEATVGSSSSSASISEDENQDDGDDEATSAPGPGQFNESFKSFGFPSTTVPRFPIPPMPLSVADSSGKFNYGRGELPALLLSWYMSGYHAGYFDARHEKKSSASGEEPTTSSKSRSKRT